MRARACIKYREFVLVRPEDPQNLNLLKEFEKKHQLHTIVTVDYSEIKGSYSKFVLNQKNNNPLNENNKSSSHKELIGFT